MTDKNIWSLIAKYRVHIMGAAALWVYAFHEWSTLFLQWGALGTALRFVIGGGFCGVDIFLLLSGMGLTHAIDKYSLGEFYKRRFLRVLLPCVLTLLGMMLLYGWSFHHFLKVASGYSFYFENMYAALWFSFAILTLYLVFPLYYALFRKASRKVLFTALMLLIWYGASIALIGTLRIDLYGFTNRIPVFLVGILCGWLSRNKPMTFRRVHWCVFAVIWAAGFACSYLTRYMDVYMLVPDSVCGVPNFLIAIGTVFLMPQILNLMDRYLPKLGKGVCKVLTFYGVMSFELYCMQEMLPTVARRILPQTAAPMLIYGLSLIGTTAISWCFAKACGWITAKLK